MGTFHANIQVANTSGGPFAAVEALVDTGSTHTLLPSRTLSDLGVAPIDRIAFELADERIVEYAVGQARLRIDGRERIALVIFGPDDATPLLGATSLELFNLAADPVGHRLVPVRGLLK